MKKVLLILFWIVFILLVNIFGRYVYVVTFEDAYVWLAYFYIEIAGLIATALSLILFFTVNYFNNKKRKTEQLFSLSKSRFLIVASVVALVFVGERIYLSLSDFIIFKKF